MDATLHELFVQWPAYQTLVEHVSRVPAREACPASVYGSLLSCDRDRLTALLFAHQHADTLSDAADLLDDLLLMAADGVRPRFGAEIPGLLGAL